MYASGTIRKNVPDPGPAWVARSCVDRAGRESSDEVDSLSLNPFEGLWHQCKARNEQPITPLTVDCGSSAWSGCPMASALINS